MTADRPRGGTVVQGGRPKAYRPLPAAERAAALQAGLEAWDRGDFFEAHELLEPAWMGSDDPSERNLHQGLIKLAAAWVHATRGNALGVAKNLDGARARLGEVGPTGDLAVGRDVDVAALLTDVDGALASLRASPSRSLSSLDPPRIRRRRP
jgi:hypothetical protein